MQVEDSWCSIEEACSMHSPALTNFELFWEKSLDTKLILAWSKTTVVLAFRGTASVANLVADIQVSLSLSQAPRPDILVKRQE